MSRQRPPKSRWVHAVEVTVLNLALSAAAVLVAGLAFWIDRQIRLSLPTVLEPLSWPLVIFGALLVLVSAVTLLRNSGATGAPGDPTPRLVTTGPYRWIRNPIYAGATLTLLGVSFSTGSPTLLLITLALLPVIHIYVCRVEEPRTAHRFGESYLAYKRSVPRWIPRLPFHKSNASDDVGRAA